MFSADSCSARRDITPALVGDGLGGLCRNSRSAAAALWTTTLTADDGRHNHMLYGYSAGFGVDMMLMAKLFLRGECEYARFTAAVDTNINTARLGLGYKF